MAITQISKIQVRSGNIDDLPQLDVGEIGWAVDARKLFIGNDTSNILGPEPDNTEILTSASGIPAAGGNTQIQFNDQGSFAASPALTFDNSSNTLSVSGNLNVGANIIGNISGPLTTRTITTGANIITGSITGNWSITDGSRLEATYADIGERYVSDEHYESGTVVAIGGSQEVTVADSSMRYKIAGVVSTNPAYVLNSIAENSVIVGLVGRLPCKVVGNISKGDFLVISDIPGVATGSALPESGATFGRALQDYSSTEVGVIEIKIDRG